LIKIKTAIALGILAASQFVNAPAKAKNFVYPPCRTVDILFEKELTKNGINPISISMDDASKNYQNYPKPGKQFSSTEILTAIVSKPKSFLEALQYGHLSEMVGYHKITY